MIEGKQCSSCKQLRNIEKQLAPQPKLPFPSTAILKRKENLQRTETRLSPSNLYLTLMHACVHVFVYVREREIQMYTTKQHNTCALK